MAVGLRAVVQADLSKPFPAVEVGIAPHDPGGAGIDEPLFAVTAATKGHDAKTHVVMRDLGRQASVAIVDLLDGPGLRGQGKRPERRLLVEQHGEVTSDIRALVEEVVAELKRGLRSSGGMMS